MWCANVKPLLYIRSLRKFGGDPQEGVMLLTCTGGGVSREMKYLQHVHAMLPRAFDGVVAGNKQDPKMGWREGKMGGEL